MVATPREDDAKDEWQQYCLAKDQARHEYEVLYSKEGSRNVFFLILAVIGLPAILLAIGLPTLLCILGAPAAFFMYIVSEKTSAELRDTERMSQNFMSFEQWKIKNSSVKTKNKNDYVNSYAVTQAAPSLNSDAEISINTKKDKRISSTLLAVKIDNSRAALKLSYAVRLLKTVCKSIEPGKALRPQENLKLLITSISKVQRRKYLDLPQLVELRLQVENIRDRFDPFTEKYVWDQLSLSGEIIQEVIDLNFE